MTFDFGFFSRGPILKGDRVTLRPARQSDYQAWSCLRAESRSFLEPWEPSWSDDELARGAYRRRLRHYNIERRRKTALTFLIFKKDSGALAGGISLTNIRRGASQSAQLGYWMGARYAGKGLMPEAVNLVVGHAFDKLLLHRIEAACIPGNARSARVLEKAGFQREGLLRSYLRIYGEWQDHELYAKVREGAPAA
jgi:ribosomal-protein-alanine N-acetyltransferase